ncbi:hypothetical protein [Sulfuricurvum sp.]
MTISQIKINLQKFIQSFPPQTFASNLLLAYGFQKSTIARL